MSALLNLATTRLLPKLLQVDDGKRLSILVYHRVLDKQDPLRPGIPDVNQFDWQMELLSKYFSPLPLGEAVNRLSDGSLPARSVCVTFDDGYADNLHNAAPILTKWNVPATIFVTSGYLDGGRMWNDTVIETFKALKHEYISLPGLGLEKLDVRTTKSRLEACHQVINALKYLEPDDRYNQTVEISKLSEFNELPTDLMLTKIQLRDLHGMGFEIGNHTQSHPILSKIDEYDVVKELCESNESIESIIQDKVRYFAYPNGVPGKDFTQRDTQIVKDLGFSGAVSTQWGVSNHFSDRWQLPRFTPWDQTPDRFVARLIMNLRCLR